MAFEIKKYIEFKYWSCYHFIALAVPIFCMLTTFIQKYELETLNKNIYECSKGINCVKPFPYFFNIFISKILSIFLVLIRRHMNKERSSNELLKNETKQMRRYHLDVNNCTKKIKAAILIIIISILELIFKIEGYRTVRKSNYRIEIRISFTCPFFFNIYTKKAVIQTSLFGFFYMYSCIYFGLLIY